ncbi:GTPase [Sphaerisporangium sp. TRM90804]|uniref:GTPase n=1 Tax=Sphaerisporangium sp. TRM90804 TaxID=3031113 RepID=UPI00244C44F4|nr:GTPase [Sphaerisporangium sp. TRM90804]MDH2430374.1 50S ribosome-binding GTPase [Sphaerisporangium sp. TRM90804]
MKVLRRSKAVSLDDRLDALARAAELAGGRLDPGAIAEVRAVVDRAGARRRLSVEHTVAALAGATGSGKSSLFNALSGTSLAQVGVTRPTTSAAQAAMWEAEGSGGLLDWLEIPRRHTVDGGDGTLSGLILLDLPDHDSIEQAHRLEVDRLVAVVDLLVWVLDPQKYADAAVHERYLRRLSRYQDVMVVVLNQIDRLTPAAADRCVADLRRLLDEDGLSGVPIIPTSVPKGVGVPDLRSTLAKRVADRRAWAARLEADVATAADALAAASCGHPGEASSSAGTGTSSIEELRERAKAAESALSGELARPLTAALAEAAGVPLVVAAVAKAHRHRSITATGWPVTRWVRRFRPDPLRRLHLGVPAGRRHLVTTSVAVPRVAGSASAAVDDAASADGHTRDGDRAGLDKASAGRQDKATGRRDKAKSGATGGDLVSAPVGRTSIPSAGAVQRSRMGTAVRDVGSAAASGLPEPWAASVRRAARSHTDDLVDRLDQAVAVTSTGAGRRPRWWRAVGLLQWLLFAAMLSGALWLTGMFALDYLRLPEPPMPTVGTVPWPTVLLIGGALAGLLLALLSRVAAALGGRRRARKARKALYASVDVVGRELVLDPVRDELAQARAFAEKVTTARG